MASVLAAAGLESSSLRVQGATREWDAQVALLTGKLTELAERIQQVTGDHSQVAYRYRSAGRILRMH
ncbi:hypothetical protein D7D52_26440 [Nocardia yunnanensis]|uniref:Uncharacterized protein n=1 Tax=Nocardia yunnanensis TaxID=2382165 RepID=A0A386ZI13_9NOCA|nr:hypothetical protein D7D52_26440 [Nocardia yunnanensis]